ncbi:MAG: neuraminidase-like domain-containing protein [Blastocatellia bacterium]
MSSFIIIGCVVNSRNRVRLAGLRVEAWDKDLIFDDMVGSAVTDEEGRFSLEFNSSSFRELFFDRQPDLFFKVFRGDELIADTSDSVVCNVSAGSSEIVIEVDQPLDETTATGPSAAQFVVCGNIRYADARPLNNGIAQAFDLGLRSEYLLGKATTDERGHYRITYTPAQLRSADRRSPNLVIRAFGPGGGQLGQSEVHFNVPALATVDLIISSDAEPQRSEYEQLLATITPALGPLQASELTDEDVGFLIRSTGVEQQCVELLRQAVGLSHVTNITAEVFYGLGRKGVPLNLGDLFQMAAEKLRAIIETAIDENIIPARLRKLLGGIMQRFQQLSFEHGFLVRKKIVGQLLNQQTGAPLVGFTVRGFDLDADVGCPDLGYDKTDSNGLFAFSYIAPRVTSGRRLRLLVTDAEGRELHQTEVQVLPDQNQLPAIRVSLPAVETPPSPTLAELVSIIGAKIDDSLLSDLSGRGIHTLADVRRAGGINLLERLFDKKSQTEIRTLASHADLGRMTSDDVKLNTFLIEKGFENVVAIARATQSSFIEATRDRMDERAASQMYRRAYGETQYLNNLLAVVFADEANGLRGAITFTNEVSGRPGFVTGHCECKDCQSAVSPLAYLADLLAYALIHVRNENKPISLQLLEDTFHQPFGKLPITCEAMSEKVRQVRLTVEVLRAHLNDQEADQRYLLAAYSSLLYHIGTSYEEMRLARKADSQTRQALADRLLVAIDRLPSNKKAKAHTLLLDPDAPETESSALTEKALMALFGFESTVESDKDATVSTPELQEWQIGYLRERWEKQDRPPDLYDAIAVSLISKADLLPIIDPDVIGPDDFRNPHKEDEGFALWIKRRLWVDDRLKAMAAIQKTVDINGKQALVPDLHELFEAMKKPVNYDSASVSAWPAEVKEALLDSLAEQLTQDENKKLAEAAADEIQDVLGLSVESFMRLAQIRAKDEQMKVDAASNRLSKEEEQELFSILVQSQKARFLQKWRDEEQENKILPGPKMFWLSISEPTEGAWPPQLLPGRPLIDPGEMKLSDLPDITAGRDARDRYEERSDSLKKVRASLKAERKAKDFEAMLKLALGHPNPKDNLQHSLDQLNKDLSDPKKFDAAKAKIENDLHMKLDAFARLMVVKSKSENPDPSKQPSEREFDDVYTILTSARKEKHEFTNWISAEQKNFQSADVAGPVYWEALKAMLPRWRASSGSRRVWQRALSDRSSAPIIDPDLISKQYLAENSSEASVLWASRSNKIHAQLETLDKTPRTQQGLDTALRTIVGIPLEALAVIEEEEQQGHSITAWLGQLSLTRAAFSYLLRIRDLLESGADVLDSEWEDVFAILLQVWKRRQFADWREEERERQIIHGPDMFKIPKPSGLVFPPPPPASLPAWRASWRDRSEWTDTLKSRIEQRDSIIQALRAAVSAAEEEALPMLRDKLIESSGQKKIAFDIKAKALTDALLIDAKAGACQETTRISQAIETMQLMLWSIRTGQLLDTYPDLTLDADDFDEEWKWMGSYATWRSAMFVFLYPENLLHPSLRKKWITPAFDGLVKNLRSNRRLTPEAAAEAARVYSAYFRDVCSLTVEASCQTPTDTSDGERCLLYLFGFGGESHKVYWSIYDPEDTTRHAQTPWQELPDLKDAKVLSIIGAVPYSPAEGQRFIYLFVRAGKPDQPKLVFIRYDLNRRHWEPKQGELDQPPGAVLDAVLGQGDGEKSPPKFGFRCGYPLAFYIRPMNAEGTALAPKSSNPSGTWEDWHYKPSDDLLGIHNWSGHTHNMPVDKLHAVFTPRAELFLIKLYLKGVDRFLYEYYFEPPTFGSNNSQWLGMFSAWEGDDYFTPFNTYVFYKDGGNTGNPVCRTSKWERSALTSGYSLKAGPTETSSLATLNKVVPNWGVSPTGLGQLVYETKEDGQIKTYRCGSHLFTGEFLLGNFNSLVVPVSTGSGVLLPPKDPQTELQSHRENVKKDFIANGVDDPLAEPHSTVQYLEEAYYFVPVYLALQLLVSGEYVAALDWLRTVYDYSAPAKQVGNINGRNIYYGLELEKNLDKGYERDFKTWLLDPLDPHAIAETRPNAYTRFTLLAIIRCLLEYADAEFTRDTAETVPRARTLYMTALELLNSSDLKKFAPSCEDRIKTVLDLFRGEEVATSMQRINNRRALDEVIEQIEVLATDQTVGHENLQDMVLAIVEQAVMDSPPPPTFEGLLARQQENLFQAHAALLSQSEVSATTIMVGTVAAESDRGRRQSVRMRDSVGPGTNHGGFEGYRKFIDTGNFTGFCIPPNALLESLRLRAELNLYKIRNCRNIAGLERQLEPYAAPTDSTSGLPMIGAGGQLVLLGTVTLQPTSYRYSVLVERAKQLAQLAGQIEATMFSAIEKHEEGLYSLLKARQDIRVSREGVRLQDLRVREAESGVGLAELQHERTQIQTETYQGWIQAGLNQYEQDMIDAYRNAASAQKTAADFTTIIQTPGVLQSFGQAGSSIGGMAGPIGSAIGAAVGMAAAAYALYRQNEAIKDGIDATISAQIASVNAALERRKDEWELQLRLALQDGLISAQQITISQDRVRVVGQERVIAEIQADHAADVAEFLTTKFTNAELYEWMAGVLEDVYRYFLQQATAVAKLAEGQLAFERQEVPPTYILADYWDAPVSDGLGKSELGKAPDRRGLTGSARLLRDIYELDEYAFATNKRKLQLSKTISLAQLDPFAFQQFRQTGLMSFATRMSLFDQNFPGHYLRLIKRVRTSVIALVPTVQGIHATLSTGGVYRVAIGGDTFQTVVKPRPPETVALTSPINASGIFELDPQSEMLLPFEGMGVDTAWEFRMPKAANNLDYRTIADVLVTLEYTALNSFDYRAQIVQELDNTVSADRPFSFRTQFADLWYDLHNPEQTATPMTVGFKTRPEDFPPNIDDLSIQHVMLYFASVADKLPDVSGVILLFTELNGGGPVGGMARSIEGLISTRKGNAGSWTSMIGKSPLGEWKLALPDEVKNRFKNEEVEDILLVITYSGHTPEWPK